MHGVPISGVATCDSLCNFSNCIAFGGRTKPPFVMDKACTSQIETMPGVDILQHARKERFCGDFLCHC